MMKKGFSIILIALVCACLLMMGLTDKNRKFSFVVLGDMPYYMPQDDVRFENVINYLNKQDQIFNVFVGDIKSSKNSCTDEVYHKMFAYFNRFKKPLIYTPGDNEWTDCGVSGLKYYDPLERLDFLRKEFFFDNKSLGMKRMDLNVQSSDTFFKKFTENRQWEYNEISFATIHVVGSNNNYIENSLDSNKEFKERLAADIYWLDKVFEEAKVNKNKGVVICVHADMFYNKKTSECFTKFLEQMKNQTIAFAKPVLLIHGDSHKFVIDKPFYTDEIQSKTILNFTRVQVFGEREMHTVKITVNPNNPSLFEVQELLVPEN